MSAYQGGWTQACGARRTIAAALDRCRRQRSRKVYSYDVVRTFLAPGYYSCKGVKHVGVAVVNRPSRLNCE